MKKLVLLLFLLPLFNCSNDYDVSNDPVVGEWETYLYLMKDFDDNWVDVADVYGDVGKMTFNFKSNGKVSYQVPTMAFNGSWRKSGANTYLLIGVFEYEDDEDFDEEEETEAFPILLEFFCNDHVFKIHADDNDDEIMYFKRLSYDPEDCDITYENE